MGAWFVVPETVRLDLANGQWIEVKKELTAGEEARMTSASLKMVRPENKDTGTPAAFEIDGVAMSFARLEAYVTDWSARDAADKPVPFSAAAVRALRKEMLAEINEALDRHLEDAGAKKPQPKSRVSAKAS